jgi:branched-chain amino acid transport system permease protein
VTEDKPVTATLNNLTLTPIDVNVAATVAKSTENTKRGVRGGLSRSNGLIAILAAGLLLLPVLGLPATNQRLIALVLIFAVFALSYDLLFGYTGIFSFGHALFFGVGAYTPALCAVNWGWSIWLGVGLGVVICAGLGIITGLVSLRVQGVFFAMVTLALASTANSLSSRMVDFTRGDEGLSLLKVADAPSQDSIYFLALGLAVIAYFGLYIVVNSPLGHVLVAIRENERRATMLGYNVLLYKVIALTFSAILAGLAGAVYAFRNGIVTPGVLSADISLLPLLMVILGGAGTLYGALIGATIIEGLNFVLSSREFVESMQNVVIVGPILQHWLLLLGLIYVLIVLFLPKGIVGSINSFSSLKNLKSWTKRQPEK